MSAIRPTTGLKAPSRITKTPSATPKSGLPKAQSALERSVRAAGIKQGSAEKYAANFLQKIPAPEPVLPPPPPDNYKVGDRCFVGGTKPGMIAYLGETQFAPGEWAGVVLDNPVGKNDGMVAGVRYFMCEAKRGVFARPSKLSQQYIEGGIPSAPATTGTPTSDTMPAPPTPSVKTSKPTNGTMATPRTTPGPARSSISRRGSVTGSTSNLAHSPTGSVSSLHQAVAGSTRLRIGERVSVSGSKTGILRFVGPADFAKGEWAGVELDDPLGKNDGAVAGKRYFTCRPLHGLFAPLHKVSRGSGVVTSTPRRTSLAKMSRERSGSNDSLSSISSATSSISRSRTGPRPSQPTTKNRPSVSATNSAIQTALKEKTEHVEQLLQERDLERSEVARVAARVDETETEMSTLRHDYARLQDESEEKINSLTALVNQLQQEKSEVVAQLDDEKRHVEDLEFTIEEEAISKDDIEVQSETDVQKLKAMQEKIDESRKKTKELEEQLSTQKMKNEEEMAKQKAAEQSADYYLDRIEELTHKLNQSENKLKAMEEQHTDEQKKSEDVNADLAAKLQRLSELEASLTERDQTLKDLNKRLSDRDEDIATKDAKQKKLQDTIDDLMKKLAVSDTASTESATEKQQLKTEIADLQRQLSAGGQQAEQLQDDKQRLEEQLSQLVEHSGDSSQQLGVLHEQLLQKDRKVEELQSDLSASTQKVGKLIEEVELVRQEGERQVDTVLAKQQEDSVCFQERLDEAIENIDKLKSKLSKQEQEYTDERASLTANAEKDADELKQQLSNKEQEVTALEQQVEVQRKTIQNETEQLQDLQFEKEKLDKSLQKMDNENKQLSIEKDSLRQERDTLLTEKKNTQDEQGASKEAITELSSKVKLHEENLTKLEGQKERAEEKCSQAERQRDNLMSERAELTVAKQKVELQQEELNLEVERLKTTVASLQEQISKLKEELDSSAKLLEKANTETATHAQQSAELEGRLKILESERDLLKVQVTALKNVKQEKEQVESQMTQVKQQIEDLRTRESQMTQDFHAERAALQKQVDQATKKIQEREADLVSTQSKLQALNLEVNSLQSVKSSLQNAEVEKQNLQSLVKQLETNLAESKANANITSNNENKQHGDNRLREEQESKAREVEFLNSVIIDQQRRIDQLSARLEAMEAGGVLNGTGGMELDLRTPGSRVQAPRLFCDICDVFDLHDTDDCPKQEMSDSPPASYNHGVRGEQREYCQICEAFGHSTETCDDEQTF